MKKWIWILIVLLFLASVCGAYLWFSDAQPDIQEPRDADMVQASQEEVVLSEEATVVYQYYFTRDLVTKETEEALPHYLAGLTRAQIEDLFSQWQLVYFAPEKLILRSGVEGKSDENFFLCQLDGYVSIFLEDEMAEMRLVEQTKMPISLLPEVEKEQFLRGFYVNGEENVAKILSDVMS